MSSYVAEQADALRKLGVDVSFFLVTGKGAIGYLSYFKQLCNTVRNNRFDVIHAHYGFSGMLAVLQRSVPVIITFHGSDLGKSWRNQCISRIAARLSKHNIFVNADLQKRANIARPYEIIPCGANLQKMCPLESKWCREGMQLDQRGKYVLFSSEFINKVKNYSLARAAFDFMPQDVELVELKGYSREEVNFLMNACSCLLVTSIRETGPLVVKEAMACNRPIVSTDVGDVKWVIGDTSGCYLTSFDPEDVAAKLKMALKFSETQGRTRGRERIIELGLDSESIAGRIRKLYDSVLHGDLL